MRQLEISQIGIPMQGFKLKYRKHPKPRKGFDSIEEQIEAIEKELWWKKAADYVLLQTRILPSVWTVLVYISDYWVYRKVDDNPAAELLSKLPILHLLCGQYYEVLFNKEPQDNTRYRIIVRNNKIVEQDVLHIWKKLTSGDNKSLPLSKCETTKEVINIIETARQELGIEHYIRAYAAGVPINDIFPDD